MIGNLEAEVAAPPHQSCHGSIAIVCPHDCHGCWFKFEGTLDTLYISSPGVCLPLPNVSTVHIEFSFYESQVIQPCTDLFTKKKIRRQGQAAVGHGSCYLCRIPNIFVLQRQKCRRQLSWGITGVWYTRYQINPLDY